MIHWIASSNWDNWKILEQKHVWGVPKRNRTLMQRVKPGDTILVYVRQEKEGDTILPSAITGAYEVVSITNKTMWSGHLRIAMREIPEEDYRLILKRAGQET